MLRLLAAVLLLFAVNLALVLAAGAAGQTQHPDVIAFVSDRTGDRDIYLLDSWHGLRLNLTRHPAADTAPAWSPDGGRLAFISDREGAAALYVLNVSGEGRRGLRRLADLQAGAYASAWSPEGSQIAYVSGGRLRIVGAEGGIPRNLDAAGELFSRPAWSPDGTRIAFSTITDQGYTLYSWNLVGGARQLIVALPSVSLSPIWSPDGTQIAFSSAMAGGFNIFVIDLRGGGLRQLTDSSINTPYGWLPDGRILFESSRAGGFDAYLMNADGSAVQRLTDNPAYDFSPAWRP